MPRYYDADALDDFINLSLSDPSHENIGFNVSYLKRCLQEMEITDAVKVVRCEDCLHGKPLGAVGTWCNRNDGLYPNVGYCSYGDRREDDES